MVTRLQPQAGEVIQNPAAGTGGFSGVADRYVKDHTDYQLLKTFMHSNCDYVVRAIAAGPR